jgi:murein DD-endopeptidase MepM/ murein hydrolase activator NlpD
VRLRTLDVKTALALLSSGFVAGALAVTLIVWQFRLVPNSSSQIFDAPESSVVADRWGAGRGKALDQDGAAVLEGAPIAPNSAVPDAGASTADSSAALRELTDRHLTFPVHGVDRSNLRDSFTEARGTRLHEAVDILAPRNTPVRAVDDGSVARLFYSKAGGITIYQYDPSAEYCYYYAHLERYASGLREGQRVSRGEIIGYVGTSGNAPSDTPHLHFAIFKLSEKERWWAGTPIDPYPLLK